jgi:hypothetical protein
MTEHVAMHVRFQAKPGEGEAVAVIEGSPQATSMVAIGGKGLDTA